MRKANVILRTVIQELIISKFTNSQTFKPKIKLCRVVFIKKRKKNPGLDSNRLIKSYRKNTEIGTTCQDKDSEKTVKESHLIVWESFRIRSAESSAKRIGGPPRKTACTPS